MKDWATLQPDRVKLLGKHFTPGRGGKKIDKVVVHHNAGVLTIDQIWQVWQTRPASAHYQVQTDGVIGQLVWDRDTAWHAANATVNATSIGIEFANSAGAGQDWPITDTTVREGARLIAAVCRYYNLGAPQAGKNVRFHREFTSTSCPYHLAPGGKYHGALMAEARRFYDQLDHPTPKETPMGYDTERATREIRAQLCGSEAVGTWRGWDQLNGNTVVDALAEIGAKLGLEGYGKKDGK